jgi:hypothetical protein
MSDDRKACPPELRAQYFQDAHGTRLKTERDLILRALRDPKLKEELKRDPKGVLSRELGLTIPADVNVQVLEETAKTVHLVIPFTSPMGKPDDAKIADAKDSLVAAGNTGATCIQFGSCC